MKKNELFLIENEIFRVIKATDETVVYINCCRKSVAKIALSEDISSFSKCNEEDLYTRLGYFPPNIEDLPNEDRRICYEKYTLIAGILPFIDSDRTRNEICGKIAKDNSISVQTVNNYLWKYLAFNTVSVFAPALAKEKELTKDQKNMRWALNKFFYTKRQNTVKTAYLLMPKKKESSGNPSRHF